MKAIAALFLVVVFAATFASKRASRALSSEMTLIPGATLQIGIDAQEIKHYQDVFQVEEKELFEPEIPKHTVTVGSFYLDKNLVTNSEFKLFVDANPRWQRDRIPAELHNGNYLRHWESGAVPPKLANHPVTIVSWYAAVAYCQWVEKRLPTEAEWEHAARGTSGGLFPWGDQPVDKAHANFGGSGLGTTSPVGSYPANEFGLFDMAGNVWEFLADEYHPYTSDSQTNPVGGGDYFSAGDNFLRVKARRVIRGGSWGGSPINLWIEYRDSHPPEAAKPFVGFRCAKSATH